MIDVGYHPTKVLFCEDLHSFQWMCGILADDYRIKIKWGDGNNTVITVKFGQHYSIILIVYIRH